MSESAVAAGIRRIEAITGDAAKRFFEAQTDTLKTIEELMKRPQDLVKAVAQLQEENQTMRKEIASLNKMKAQLVQQELEGQIQETNGQAILCAKIEGDAQMLKDLSFAIGKKRKEVVIVLAAVVNEKPLLSCYIPKPLVEEKGWNAGAVVRDLGKHIQGGGGGQPFFATAGGKNPAGISNALQAAEAFFGK